MLLKVAWWFSCTQINAMWSLCVFTDICWGVCIALEQWYRWLNVTANSYQYFLPKIEPWCPLMGLLSWYHDLSKIVNCVRVETTITWDWLPDVVSAVVRWPTLLSSTSSCLLNTTETIREHGHGYSIYSKIDLPRPRGYIYLWHVSSFVVQQ